MERRGFTLTEVLITVMIIGILASAAVVNYVTAVQRSRWDVAQEILVLIYEGEKKYASIVNPAGTFEGDATLGPVVCPDATCQARWRNSLFMDDPNQAGAAVTYQVRLGGGGPTTFLATATLVGNGLTQTVDQDRLFGGTWPRP